MTEKTHIYFMPGLGADYKIFEYLDLSDDNFELHFLEWIIPESVDESLEKYAKRLCLKVTEINPILVGVSFGGILVQEMAKFIETKKVIIISSVKENNEIPRRMKLLRVSKLYKFFPTKKIANTKNFSELNFPNAIRKKTELYDKFFNSRNEVYLDWAIHQMLNWKSADHLKNIIHIHGSADHIFPIKHIQNCIVVEGGTHAMIITKGKKISALLQEIF